MRIHSFSSRLALVSPRCQTSCRPILFPNPQKQIVGLRCANPTYETEYRQARNGHQRRCHARPRNPCAPHRSYRAHRPERLGIDTVRTDGSQPHHHHRQIDAHRTGVARAGRIERRQSVPVGAANDHAANTRRRCVGRAHRMRAIPASKSARSPSPNSPPTLPWIEKLPTKPCAN
jgi:hypothetical protein